MSTRSLALAALVVLAVLHQDAWFWDDPTIVFGVLPIGLAWHAAFSVACAAVWFAVVKVAWPSDPHAPEAAR